MRERKLASDQPATPTLAFCSQTLTLSLSLPLTFARRLQTRQTNAYQLTNKMPTFQRSKRTFDWPTHWIYTHTHTDNELRAAVMEWKIKSYAHWVG